MALVERQMPQRGRSMRHKLKHMHCQQVLYGAALGSAGVRRVLRARASDPERFGATSKRIRTRAWLRALNAVVRGCSGSTSTVFVRVLWPETRAERWHWSLQAPKGPAGATSTLQGSCAHARVRYVAPSTCDRPAVVFAVRAAAHGKRMHGTLKRLVHHVSIGVSAGADSCGSRRSAMPVLGPLCSTAPVRAHGRSPVGGQADPRDNAKPIHRAISAP